MFKSILRLAGITILASTTLLTPALAATPQRAMSQAGSLVIDGSWQSWGGEGTFFIKAVVDKKGVIANPQIYYSKPGYTFRGTLSYLGLTKTKATFFGTGSMKTMAGKTISCYLRGVAVPGTGPRTGGQVDVVISAVDGSKFRIHEHGAFNGMVRVSLLS